MNKLTEEKREAYFTGLQAMWEAFRYAAYDEKIDLKAAVYKYGKWLDAVVQPWIRGDLKVIGHLKWNELPLPPGVERLSGIKNDKSP